MREKLLDLIYQYEAENRREENSVTEQQIEDSEKAEELIKREQNFIRVRKELIRRKLKEYDLNQQELGELLGHSKSQMSELIDDVSSFSIKDLVVIHRLFQISFDDLIPTFLDNEIREQITLNIQRLNKPKLKFSKENLYA